MSLFDHHSARALGAVATSLVLLAAHSADAQTTTATRYGAAPDGGETDDPRVDRVRYAGTVYYISCTTGDDDHDGRSASRAWKTLAKVNEHTEVGYWDTVPGRGSRTGKHGVLTAAPNGSAFLFERGCTFRGHINVHAWQRGGAKPAYSVDFTFGAYGDRTKSRPRITTEAPAEKVRATVWSNGHAIHLHNLHLLGDPASAKPGVWLRKSRGSSIVNSVVENMAGDGVHAGESEDLLIQNSVFRNNQLLGKPGGGVTGSGRNLRILDSTFVDNGRHRILAHNIYLSSLEHALIQGNHIEGGSNLGIVIHGMSEDVRIVDNDIFGNSNGIDISGGYPKKTESFSRMLIERNRIHHNGMRPKEQGYGLLLKSVIDSSIRNNVVYANRIGPLVLADGNPGDPASTNVTIEHNVFHSPGRGPSFVGAALSAIALHNNIVVALGSEGHALSKAPETPDNALTTDGNLYHAPNLSPGAAIRWGNQRLGVGDMRTLLGLEQRGTNADPAFIDPEAGNFRLRAGSPARRSEVPVGVLEDLSRSPRQPGPLKQRVP